MVEINLLSLTKIEDNQLEAPISFGTFNDYLPFCCYIAITSNYTINLADCFKLTYNPQDMVFKMVAFDSYEEASEFLKNEKDSSKYVLEASFPKEKLDKRKVIALGKHIIKAINYHNNESKINPDHTLSNENNVSDFSLTQSRHHSRRHKVTKNDATDNTANRRMSAP